MNRTQTLFAPLVKILQTLKNRSAEPSSDPDVSYDLVKLDKILLLFATRPGRSEPFRILTAEMSPDCVIFSTTERVRPGERLELRFLLSHGFASNVSGTVNWVMRSEQGYSGQLDLEGSLGDQMMLLQFLREHRKIS